MNKEKIVKKEYKDGYLDGCADTRFNIMSLIYDHWDAFIEMCRKYEELPEKEWIAKMCDYYDVNKVD